MELLVRSRDAVLGKYCNLISRIGAKNFNIAKSVQYYSSGKFDDIEQIIRNTSNSNSEVLIITSQELISNLNNLYSTMDKHFKAFDYIRAIQAWWLVINQSNYLFQTAEPWKYTKLLKDETTPDDIKAEYLSFINYVTYLCAETVRISSILIQPVMPHLATKILDRLQVQNRDSDACKVGAELEYGKDANSKKHGVPLDKVNSRL